MRGSGFPFDCGRAGIGVGGIENQCARAEFHHAVVGGIADISDGTVSERSRSRIGGIEADERAGFEPSPVELEPICEAPRKAVTPATSQYPDAESPTPKAKPAPEATSMLGLRPLAGGGIVKRSLFGKGNDTLGDRRCAVAIDAGEGQDVLCLFPWQLCPN